MRGRCMQGTETVSEWRYCQRQSDLLCSVLLTNSFAGRESLSFRIPMLAKALDWMVFCCDSDRSLYGNTAAQRRPAESQAS